MNKTLRRDALALMVLIAERQAVERGKLTLWTIYDHPKDYPDGFIARMHEISDGPTKHNHIGTLKELRAIFRRADLICHSRKPGDDPEIVETWW